MQRIFAIGDIHGCLDPFRKLLLEKIQIRKSDTVYCLGDYIDRGSNSKGVIDLILELRSKGFRIRTIRGNHEQLMMDSAGDERIRDVWIENGGEATLESFGISSYEEMDPVYKQFFAQTKFFLRSGKFIFVHAGLNFNTSDPLADKDAMLWIRNFSIDPQWLGDRYLIHGHTPITIEEIFRQQGTRTINLDGGCVFTFSPGLGNLVALNISEGKFISVRNFS